MTSPSIAALSPYLIPPLLQAVKVRNLGDGFILRAIERRLGRRFPAELVVSPRVEPDAETKLALRSASGIILAGANQLHDRYTVWPGLKAADIVANGWKFIPFGIGIHGEPGFNDGMSGETKAVLEAIHDATHYSSWRCPLTVEYLRASLPHLAERFLMTGCPVTYDEPLLDGERFHEGESVIAVTATERGQFWERETTIIDAAAKRFPHARKYFVIHQNYSPPAWHERLNGLLHRSKAASMANKVAGLRAYARERGFTVVVPEGADECLAFYGGVDIHVGTRLHAHLHFLSQNKRTFLVPVDNRSAGMADFLGFALPSAHDLPRHWDADFEPVRRNARKAFQTMQKFTSSFPS